jgi:hypothetical protein
LTNLLLTTWLIVDSTKAVLIGSLTVPLAEVRDELLVVANIRIELTDALAEFGICGRERSKKIQLYDRAF